MKSLASRLSVELSKPPRTLAGIMSDYERVIVIQALQLNGFCRSRAAISLGLSRSGLWRRMRLLHIDFSALPKARPGPRKPICQGQS